MAFSEKAPLLVNTEDQANDFGDEIAPNKYSNEAPLNLPSERVNGAIPDGDLSSAPITAADVRLSLLQDHVVAIFVVAFDTHRGK